MASFGKTFGVLILMSSVTFGPVAALAQGGGAGSGSSSGAPSTGETSTGSVGTAPSGLGGRKPVMTPGNPTAAPVEDSERRMIDVERKSDTLTRGICTGC